MSLETRKFDCRRHDLFASSQDFTLVAREVELIVTANLNHFRVLGNKNLTVLGPFVLDADPLGWTQGEIVAINPEDWTIDARIFDGYAIPTEGERIELFTTEGVMLPHSQDAVQVVILHTFALVSFPVGPSYRCRFCQLMATGKPANTKSNWDASLLTRVLLLCFADDHITHKESVQHFMAGCPFAN